MSVIIPVVAADGAQSTVTLPAPVVNAGTSMPTPAITPASGTWQLVFEDNFNGTILNTNYWAKTIWGGGVKFNGTTMNASNVVVSGGKCAITLASATSGGGIFGGNAPSATTWGFKCGAPCVWEARILNPGNGSKVYNWPTLWTLDDSGDGQTVEIDINEVWNGVTQTNYHVNNSQYSTHSYPGYYGGAYHTWTLYRTRTGSDYIYVDGTLQYTMPTSPGDTGLPQYFIYNIGAAQGGAATVAPQTYYIDYVRCWIPSVGGGTVVNPHGGWPG